MQAWNEFLIQQEAELGVETVQKWLKTLKVLHFDACNLYLEAKDTFQIMWFEEHLRAKIKSLFVNNNNKKIKVHLTVANAQQRKTKTKRNIPSTTTSLNLEFDDLDPYCHFENYIASEKNALAEKLLKSLADPSSPSNKLGSFNPIYIHGSSGSGKTHLLMSTAHALQQQGLKVLYTRAETFTEHVVSAIRLGEMSLFRQTYRNQDVLIVDGVQFFSKKAATQEEFFHTFNTLHLENKQIILSSDCAPAELQSIEPRLISRFEWGIVLNLFPLNQEDLAKVLHQKADFMNFPIHSKVSDFILEHFGSGCKSLMKAFDALVLRTHMTGQSSKSSQQITVPVAKQILQDLLLEEQQRALTPHKAIQLVAEVFGIKADDIMGKGQKRELVFPRQIAMHLCRNKLKMPYTKIGDLFEKDHSTVMTSVKLIQTGLEENNHDILSHYQSIQKKLEAI